MDFQSLFQILKDAGLPGLVIGLLVLVVVWLLSFTDLLKVGWMKRLAAVALSFLFAGVEDAEIESAVIAAIALVISTLVKMGLDGLQAEYGKRKLAPK